MSSCTPEFNSMSNKAPVQVATASAATSSEQEGVAVSAAPLVVQQPQQQPVQVVTVVQQQDATVLSRLHAVRLKYPEWQLNLGSVYGCHSSCDAVNCPWFVQLHAHVGMLPSS